MMSKNTTPVMHTVHLNNIHVLCCALVSNYYNFSIVFERENFEDISKVKYS